MSRALHISVNNKIATYQQRDGSIVCGNSDYQISFTFDSEWDDYTDKVARFIWNGKFQDVILDEDNVAQVPLITQTQSVTVGVYAGELSTTTPALIPCKLSILCEGAESEQEAVVDKNGALQYRIPSATSGENGDILEIQSGAYVIVSIADSKIAEYVDEAIEEAISTALTTEVDV